MATNAVTARDRLTGSTGEPLVDLLTCGVWTGALLELASLAGLDPGANRQRLPEPVRHRGAADLGHRGRRTQTAGPARLRREYLANGIGRTI